MTGPHPTTESYRLPVTRLAQQGATLQEIGDALGLSRERGRQLLHRFGLYDSWKAARRQVVAIQKQNVAEARAERYRAAHMNRTDWRFNHPGLDRRVSDEFLLQCLKDAAGAVGEPLSAIRYDQWRDSVGKTVPNVPRYYQIYGSWSAACRAAGVQCGETKHGPYTKTYTDEQCDQAVARVARKLGKLPSIEDYQKHHLPGEPGAQTIRNRAGNSWGPVLRKLREAGVA